jgi:hypothetical protein
VPISAPTSKPNATADVGKTLIGNVAPNAVANAAANLTSVPATVGSYAAQIGTKGGEYLGEGIDELQRMARGQPTKSQADYDSEQKDLMNAIRGKMGLSPTDSGDISQLVPTPSNLLNAGMNAMGTPLYQPKTEAGKQAEIFGNIATAGAGSGVKVLPALMGAAGATGGGEAVKQAGGTQAEQFLASLAGGIGAGKLGETTAPEEPLSAEDQAINTLGTKTPETPSYTSADLRARAKPYYDYSKSQGVDFTPETQAAIPDAINSALLKTGKMNASLHSDTLSVLGDLQKEADAGTLDMESLHQYRQLFGDVVNGNLHPNGKMMPDAMKANSAIDAIDNILERAKNDPTMLNKGNPDAIDAWQKGQQLWAASARASDIERIMQRAEFMQNPATSMRQGFASLAGNQARLSRFTPEQQSMIKDAASSNLGIEAMRAIGSRLIPYALLGAHNPLAAIAAIPVAAAGRSLAGSMQAVKGQKIINDITNNAPGSFQKPQPVAAPLALPAPPIRVPEGGFGTPEPTPSATEVNYNPAQRALPAPKEMSYEDMMQSGRLLPNPETTAMAMPSGAVSRTYNPNDLNVSGDVAVPETKVESNPTIPATKTAPPINLPKKWATEPELPLSKQQKPYSFFDVIRKAGGIKPQGDENLTNVIDVGSAPRGLIKQNGMTHEQALNLGIREGFIKDNGAGANPTANDLGDLYSALENGKQPHPKFAGSYTAADYRDNLENEADKRGIDHQGLSNDQLVAELDTHAAAEREKLNAYETGKAQGSQGGVGGSIQGNEQLKATPNSARGAEAVLEGLAKGHSPAQSAFGNDEIPFKVGGRTYAKGGRINANPTEAQKEAGNYRKDHIRLYGLGITIENPKGSKRSGTDKNGKSWSCKMPCAYGYVKGTVGADKDHVDCFIGDKKGSPMAFLIDQKDSETGKFDEHKIMLGFMSEEKALNAYRKSFSDSKSAKRIGAVTRMSIEKLKQWLNSGKTKKPLGMAA